MIFAVLGYSLTDLLTGTDRKTPVCKNNREPPHATFRREQE
jgi:hypothetical protein